MKQGSFITAPLFHLALNDQPTEPDVVGFEATTDFQGLERSKKFRDVTNIKCNVIK